MTAPSSSQAPLAQERASYSTTSSTSSASSTLLATYSSPPPPALPPTPLNGLTLHSFAGVGHATDPSPDLLLHKVRCNIPAFKHWRFAKALIVNEISMIDGQLFDRLEFIAYFLRLGRKTMERSSMAASQQAQTNREPVSQ
ncbi:hypothetical protein MRB53_032582 [Persea americana]|uniref:Uncharacterized protein n=1 Tax=Persea americana TaxID=3435 RepID=A0ACC2KSM0_PERAE|nr:hypothetical protein MRB53_032582 [Persea americana]